jgi:hypothetical protein
VKRIDRKLPTDHTDRARYPNERLCVCFASLRLQNHCIGYDHLIERKDTSGGNPKTGSKTGLLETEFAERRGLTAEPDRDAFVVGDNRKAVLPNQLLQSGHFVRFFAEVDFAIDDTSPIKILTERSAMRTPVGGEDHNRIERGHSIPSSEF